MADELPGLLAYDLQPPLRPLTPKVLAGVGGFGRYTPPPRYKPQPLLPGMSRVVLMDGYETGAEWSDYRAGASVSPESVFDIPEDQRERWRQAVDACERMQDEIRLLLERRSHR